MSNLNPISNHNPECEHDQGARAVDHLGLGPGDAMLAPCVAAPVSPPTSARSSSSSSGQGRLGAPDDLCRAGDAKDLDETGHLVEQENGYVGDLYETGIFPAFLKLVASAITLLRAPTERSSVPTDHCAARPRQRPAFS